MRRALGAINKNQKGLTLIEILVAIAVSSFIGVGIMAAISQMFTVNALSTNHVNAVKQVEKAVYWLSRDAQMAQIVQPAGGSGFPLNLSWVEWDNAGHQVTYTLENDKLRRSHSVNGGEPSWITVAEHMNTNPEKLNCQFASGVFTFKVTTSISGFRSASETRTAQVIPRAAP